MIIDGVHWNAGATPRVRNWPRDGPMPVGPADQARAIGWDGGERWRALLARGDPAPGLAAPFLP